MGMPLMFAFYTTDTSYENSGDTDHAVLFRVPQTVDVDRVTFLQLKGRGRLE